MTDSPNRGSRTKPPHGGFFLASGDFFDDLVELKQMKYGETYALYYQVKMVDPFYPERGWTGDTLVDGPDLKSPSSVTVWTEGVRVKFTDNKILSQDSIDDEKVWVWKA